jgi:outer membrane protein assembly factor BamD (BamD/ComL family)
MEESARGVFRAKLHNLGVQFAICVTDQRWAEAIEVGEQIISEYPNTRMASEVRSKMDQLRARAGIHSEQG